MIDLIYRVTNAVSVVLANTIVSEKADILQGINM